MRIRFLRQTMLILMTTLVIGLCFVDTSAQRTRNKRSRRVTNPVRKSSSTAPVTQPTPSSTTTGSDARIISTADDPENSTTNEEPPVVTTRRTNRSRTAPASDTEEENTRSTVNRLSRQVDQLTDKINQIEGAQRTLVDLERLSRAEQRAEAFRAQLRDVQEKEANLQSRLDQLEYDIKPENIERSVGMNGTTHPEEVREARRRQLENERTRIRSQLDLLYTSRTRLEAAIALADTEVERLRARLDTDDPLAKPQTGTDNSTEPPTSTDTTTDTTTATPTKPAPTASPYGTP
jgi:phage shock protein A